tara:strand:+ start:287 stop:712 length:426 start_codon:yes stop_codon:yes gene_type:complete
MKNTILFLCSKNTCRSAFTEVIAKEIFGDKYHIESAGIEVNIPLEPMNKYAQYYLCGHFNCNTKHKSKKVTNSMLNNAKYIFIMEKKMKKKINEQYHDKLYLLCDKDIKDPYNKKNKELAYQTMSTDIIKCLVNIYYKLKL